MLVIASGFLSFLLFTFTVQCMSLDNQVFFGICFGGMLWKRFSDCMPSKSYIKKLFGNAVQTAFPKNSIFFFFAKI
jgi:hypothetical protein